MYNETEESILGLAREFFDEDPLSEEELKAKLSVEEQRNKFIKWVEDEISSWIKR